MEEPLLSKLITVATAGNIDYIRELLDGIREPKKFSTLVNWADAFGFTYGNSGVRYLAGAIMEMAPIPEKIFGRFRDKVFEAMMREYESNLAKYQFAFALAAHGPGKYLSEVTPELEKALDDEKVSRIAEMYLEKLSKRKEP